jgi:hypothetical protein
VVAVVEPGFALTLNPAEVTDAFEVPLAFLLDPPTTRSTAASGKDASGSTTRFPSASVTSGA